MILISATLVSADRPGTDTVLHTHISSLYPNSSVVITQDRSFDLFRFAASHLQDVKLTKMTDMKSIEYVAFKPPLRRRFGDGQLGEKVTFAGYKVMWEEHAFDAIVATVSLTGPLLTKRNSLIHISGPKDSQRSLSGISLPTIPLQLEL